MNFEIARRACIAVFLFTVSNVALAQHPATVGDLLDQGGRKLTKVEVSKLIAGNVMSGPQVNNPTTKFANSYNEDGSFRGNSVGSNRVVNGVWGTWVVDENGIMRSTINSSNGARFAGTSVFFSLGSSYFAAQNEDRTSPLSQREFSK